MREDLVVREVYLDNAATTRVDERIVKLMTEVMLDAYGNPSSVHRVGRKAKVYLDKAREQVAALLNAQKDEIFSSLPENKPLLRA